MQRESQLTQPDQRRKTAEMAILIGQALEEVSKATGSVAHFYKKFEMGPNPGQCRVKPTEYDPLFEAIVKDTGVIGSRAGAASADEEEKKEEPEESKSSAQPSSAAASSTPSAQPAAASSDAG